MLRVWWRMPGTSEARKNSPSADAEDGGGSHAGGDESVGRVGGEDADGEGSGEAFDGAADGFVEGEPFWSGGG